MTDKISAQVDLFGEPWRPLKDQRGRKGHKWSKQHAETVAVLRASGQSQDLIAMRLGLDPKTLRKYYSRELDHGPALALALVDEVMWSEAKAGKVSAARYIRDAFEKGKPKRISEAPKAAAPTKVGKKEEQQKAAQAVGGIYSTRPTPGNTVQ